MIVFKVILPCAMPGILAGFRISSSIALILVVAAEMIGADTGIGAFVLAAGNLMQTDQLVVGVVLLSILGLLISRSEEHTSELQSLMRISYAVFCVKTKIDNNLDRHVSQDITAIPIRPHLVYRMTIAYTLLDYT